MTYLKACLSVVGIFLSLLSGTSLAQTALDPTDQQVGGRQPSPPPQSSAQAAATDAAPPARSAPPADLIRTFAPLGLIAEFNSNENFAGFATRLGTLAAHQAAANSGGATAGYRDGVDSLALPLRITVSLDDAQEFYLKVGFAPAWSNGHGGNLTEGDSSTSSGSVGLNYRPAPNLVLGLGLAAGRTNLDLRHNGGSSNTEYLGVQAEYMHRISPNFGLTARALWSGGTTDVRIPLGTSGQTVSYTQDNQRIYLEASAMGQLPASWTGFLPQSVAMRPIATIMFQRTDFARTQDSLGRLRPATDEELGIARVALRFEKREARLWRLIPYAVLGVEREFVNSVSRLDHDPANSYLKAGLGVNVGGYGRVDLFYVRRDSFRGTYNANQITLFASLLF